MNILFWFIFGNLYIKYRIIFKGLNIDFSKNDICLWCGNTVEDINNYKDLLKDCDMNDVKRCELKYTCGRCKHSVKFDLLKIN